MFTVFATDRSDPDGQNVLPVDRLGDWLGRTLVYQPRSATRYEPTDHLRGSGGVDEFLPADADFYQPKRWSIEDFDWPAVFATRLSIKRSVIYRHMLPAQPNPV